MWFPYAAYTIRGIDPAFDSTSVFGSFSQTFIGASRDRGNIYAVTRNSVLKEIRAYLDMSNLTSLYFFVYEGDARNGTYTRIFQTNTVTPVGAMWYESGPIEVHLRSGKFYYIGASWLGSVTYGRAPDSTFTGLIETDFGSLVTGQSFNVAGYPPAGTINGSQFSNVFAPYYQSIKVNTTQSITLLPDQGQIAPEGSQQVMIHFNAQNLSVGDYYPEFTIRTNDPNNVVRVVSGHVIEYHLPTRRHVSLKIYDLLGGEVSTLVDRVQESGKYTVSWDARVSNTAVSGIYFYRLAAGEFIQIRKMVLMK